jgi:hypothetical protein
MTITTDGTTYFAGEDFRPGRLVLLDISGTFAGATVVPGYKATDGTFTPYMLPDSSGSLSLTSRGGVEVRVPRSGKVGVTVSAATGSTSLVLDVIDAIETPDWE